MTEAATTIKASEVVVGDRVRARSGTELTVTRIDTGFMGMPNMLAFVEDSEQQWFKMPAPSDADVELIRRAESRRRRTAPPRVVTPTLN